MIQKPNRRYFLVIAGKTVAVSKKFYEQAVSGLVINNKLKQS